MSVLLVDDRSVGPIEVATTALARARGLLGREGLDGALLIQPASSVHTIGMRFRIDVAFCTRDLVVIDTVTMSRYRWGRPRLRARAVLEAESGAFARWHLAVGSRLTVAEGV